MGESVAKVHGTRAKLATVLQAAGDIVHIEDAVNALCLSRTQAAKTLSRWAKQGLIRRVGPGAYIPVPLDAFQNEQILADHWLLVPALYEPAYIGGRTAAEYWGLTEQIFRDIVVMTAQHVRRKSQKQHGVLFSLKHIRENSIFGMKTVWRGRTRIAISDVNRTIIDMLHDPAMGGGIQHVSDCLSQYLIRKDRSLEKLIDYGDKLSNGAVFKRLGFLAEGNPNGAELIKACQARLTKGNAKLDPSLECTRLKTKWRLLVPSSWA